MGRWEPGARSRLAAAAMEQGYEQTTVADIAGRAGLTSRTFFRYFADKREVVFAGGSQLEGHLVVALAAAPADATAMQAIEAAFRAVGEVIRSRAWSADRQSVVALHPELRERELAKMASLSAALGDALRTRGVPAADAGLAAEAGVMVFRLAFERWLDEADDRTLTDVLTESFVQLRALTAGVPGPPAAVEDVVARARAHAVAAGRRLDVDGVLRDRDADRR